MTLPGTRTKAHEDAQILKLAGEGLSQAEVARITGRSPHTIRRRLEGMGRGVYTRAQLLGPRNPAKAWDQLSRLGRTPYGTSPRSPACSSGWILPDDAIERAGYPGSATFQWEFRIVRDGQVVALIRLQRQIGDVQGVMLASSCDGSGIGVNGKAGPEVRMPVSPRGDLR